MKYADYQFSSVFKKTLESIPFINKIEIIPSSKTIVNNRGYRMGMFHAKIQVQNDLQPLLASITIWNSGQPRYIKEFIEYAKSQKETLNILMAPYVSELSAQQIRNEELSFMDLSGNCCLCAPGLYVYMGGNKNQHIRKNNTNYLSRTSRMSGHILRAMLQDYEKVWQVKELSEDTGRGIGTVSNLKSFLQDHNWIAIHPEGFSLCNIKDLLFSWGREYNKKKTSRIGCQFYCRAEDMESDIAKWAALHPGKIVLTGTSAAQALGADPGQKRRIDVYVHPELTQTLIEELDLEPTEAGGNLIINVADDETPFLYAKAINGLPLASREQVVLDLLDGSSKGQSLAQKLMEWYTE